MQLFTDNASSTIAVKVELASTTIQVAPNDGAKFPNPQNGDFFLVTLFQRVGIAEQNWEIVACTQRVGDVLTVTRARNGTAAFAFNIGDFIELRLVAGSVLPVRDGALTGALNEAPIATIPSAATIAIGAAGGNTISVTGTTPISAFDLVGSGAMRRMTFTGTLTLTHNVSALRLLTGANITTAAGDWCEWISLGGGVWQMMNYTKANGASLTADATKASLGSNTFTGGQSYSAIDKGTVSSGEVNFSFLAGNVQRLQVAGAVTIKFSGFPAAGVLGDMMLKLVNGGAAPVTFFQTINWILPTGATTTSLATYLAAISRGTTFQLSGTDFIYVWTDDGGTTIYGKLQ